MLTPLFYHLALLQVPLIGPVQAKLLLQHFAVEDIFKAKKTIIEKIEGIGDARAESIKQFSDFARIEKELKFIEKYKITPLLYTNENYPQRLLKFHDSPTVLYYKGDADLNHQKNIAIVGSRSHSQYGRDITEELVKDLAAENIHIISGMAAGIDAIAHRTSIAHKAPTVGVLAHGLDRIYPTQHTALAKEILQTGGGLLTEFMSASLPERYNFPRRNRIVAGISDATVIIETSESGGSMITAQLAMQYKKQLFALPGKTTDIKSKGCNMLIQNGSAKLLQHADDILLTLGWKSNNKNAKQKANAIQQTLLLDFTADEKIIVDLLNNHNSIHIDEITALSALSNSNIAAAMLSLELQNVVLPLPGKMYKLV